MKVVILSALAASSVSAFTLTQPRVSSVALRASDDDWAAIDFSGETGVVAPLGFWDPLKLMETFDEEEFYRWRVSEITHGRIAMLAVVGYLTTLYGVRLPGCEDVPSGLAAFSEAPDSYMSWMYLTWFALGLYTYPFPDDDGVFEPQFPGDLRRGDGLDFGWDRKPASWQLSKRNTEINNGRAAMMGIAGLVVHESLGNLNEIVPGLN